MERNPPLILFAMESTSDQNQTRIEVESASSMSSREKITIKGVVPDRFFIKTKHETLPTTTAHRATARRGSSPWRPSASYRMLHRRFWTKEIGWIDLRSKLPPSPRSTWIMPPSPAATVDHRRSRWAKMDSPHHCDAIGPNFVKICPP
jgi:hypothetical protein